MSDELTPEQIREAHIRMEGSAEKRREILAKILCAYCGKPAEGNFSIHADDFCVGPEWPLCDKCGDEVGPTIHEIRRKIFMETKPVMDLEDELLKMRMERDQLRLLGKWAVEVIDQEWGGLGTVGKSKELAELRKLLKL